MAENKPVMKKGIFGRAESAIDSSGEVAEKKEVVKKKAPPKPRNKRTASAEKEPKTTTKKSVSVQVESSLPSEAVIGDQLTEQTVEVLRNIVSAKDTNNTEDSIKFFLPESMKKVVNLYIKHDYSKESDMSKFMRNATLEYLEKHVPELLKVAKMMSTDKD